MARKCCGRKKNRDAPSRAPNDREEGEKSREEWKRQDNDVRTLHAFLKQGFQVLPTQLRLTRIRSGFIEVLLQNSKRATLFVTAGACFAAMFFLSRSLVSCKLAGINSLWTARFDALPGKGHWCQPRMCTVVAHQGGALVSQWRPATAATAAAAVAAGDGGDGSAVMAAAAAISETAIAFSSNSFRANNQLIV
ncbi:unnamed protein product, partial [Phaeothamnion confervicola]